MEFIFCQISVLLIQPFAGTGSVIEDSLMHDVVVNIEEKGARQKE